MKHSSRASRAGPPRGTLFEAGDDSRRARAPSTTFSLRSPRWSRHRQTFHVKHSTRAIPRRSAPGLFRKRRSPPAAHAGHPREAAPSSRGGRRPRARAPGGPRGRVPRAGHGATRQEIAGEGFPHQLECGTGESSVHHPGRQSERADGLLAESGPSSRSTRRAPPPGRAGPGAAGSPGKPPPDPTSSNRSRRGPGGGRKGSASSASRRCRATRSLRHRPPSSRRG